MHASLLFGAGILKGVRKLIMHCSSYVVVVTEIEVLYCMHRSQYTISFATERQSIVLRCWHEFKQERISDIKYCALLKEKSNFSSVKIL